MKKKRGSKREHDRGIFRAIYVSLWDDPDFLRLSPNEKLILLNLRTGPLTNMPCIYRFYKEAIRDQTGLSDRVIDTVLDTLSGYGWIQIEQGIIWVKNALKYDPYISLLNPLHIEAIKKCVHSLPKLKIVMEFCIYYGIEIPYKIPIQDGIGDGIVMGIGNREEEKEKEKEKEEEGVGKKKDWATQLIEIFNSTVKYLPKITLPSGTRQKKINARKKEKPDFGWWKAVFKMADQVLIPGKNGRKDWFPTFDWLIENDTNAIKVIEGNYADAKRPIPRGKTFEAGDLWERAKEEQYARERSKAIQITDGQGEGKPSNSDTIDG